MKKLKTILALMLATVIMCFSVTPAFAEDSEHDLKAAYSKLHGLCWEAVYDYGITASKQGCYFNNFPGERIPNVTSKSSLVGREVLHETDDFLNDSLVNGNVNTNSFTVEDFEKQYNKFYTTLNSLVLSKGTLKAMILFCSEEQNNNGYYSDELWNDFCEKLNTAQAIYDAPETTEDFVVTETYFELLHSHFKLCSSNTMFGDIDNDSALTIMDVSYIQKACAELVTLNSSQQLIAKKDIAYASEIQRYIAFFCDNVDIENSSLNTYIEYTEYSDIHSDKFRFRSWKYNYFYIEYTTPTPVSYPVYLDNWIYT